jgi:hypothetical protein
MPTFDSAGSKSELPTPARTIHHRRMACLDPKRMPCRIACQPPQADLRSVEEAGAGDGSQDAR